MTTKYPAQIDTSVEIPAAVDNQTPVNAKLFNNLRSALLAIEKELGTRPSGVSATVKARLDTLDNTLSNFELITLSNDLGGTLTNPLVIGIQGQPVSTETPEYKEALFWNGLAWEAAPVDYLSGDNITITSVDYTVISTDGYLNFSSNDDMQLSAPSSKSIKLKPGNATLNITDVGTNININVDGELEIGCNSLSVTASGVSGDITFTALDDIFLKPDNGSQTLSIVVSGSTINLQSSGNIGLVSTSGTGAITVGSTLTLTSGSSDSIILASPITWSSAGRPTLRTIIGTDSNNTISLSTTNIVYVPAGTLSTNRTYSISTSSTTLKSGDFIELYNFDAENTIILNNPSASAITTVAAQGYAKVLYNGSSWICFAKGSLTAV